MYLKLYIVVWQIHFVFGQIGPLTPPHWLSRTFWRSLAHTLTPDPENELFQLFGTLQTVWRLSSRVLTFPVFSVEDKYSHTHMRAHTHTQSAGRFAELQQLYLMHESQRNHKVCTRSDPLRMTAATHCVCACVCADLYSHSGFSFSKRFHCLFFQHCSEPPLLHPALNFHRGVNVRPRPLTDALMHTHTHTHSQSWGVVKCCCISSPWTSGKTLHISSTEPTCDVTRWTTALWWFLWWGPGPPLLPLCSWLSILRDSPTSQSFPSSGTPDSSLTFFSFFLRRKTSRTRQLLVFVFWKCCSHESLRCNLDLMYSQQQSKNRKPCREDQQSEAAPRFTYRENTSASGLLLSFVS